MSEPTQGDNEFAAIYARVRAIPVGRVMSYGAVGAAVGAGPRTVGWAMAQVPQGVPWHRVVGADGYLRIAARSPHLRHLQQSLLEAEGVAVNEKNIVPREYFTDEG